MRKLLLIVLASSLVFGSLPCLAGTARVPKTGQTIRYGPRDDGKMQKGVAWPVPRFTDNKDGTVTDNLTMLVWLKDASCKVFFAGDDRGINARTWAGALKAANNLADGYCGLTDGSKAGQWRLPNRRELESLLHLGFSEPAIPDTEGTGKWSEGNAFSGVDHWYWSSTAVANQTGILWAVSTVYGQVSPDLKSKPLHVWPVRDP